MKALAFLLCTVCALASTVTQANEPAQLEVVRASVIGKWMDLHPRSSRNQTDYFVQVNAVDRRHTCPVSPTQYDGFKRNITVHIFLHNGSCVGVE